MLCSSSGKSTSTLADSSRQVWAWNGFRRNLRLISTVADLGSIPNTSTIMQNLAQYR